MAEPNLVFFDIDGTLFNEEKKVPASTKEAIRQLKEKRTIVGIATGRGPFKYKELRDELHIDTYLSFNGNYAVLNGKELYKNTLNPETLDQMVEYAHEKNHPIVFMDEENMMANVEESLEVKEAIDSLKLITNPMKYDPLFYQKKNIIQCLLFCQEGEEKNYETMFPDFHFVRWHKYSVDVIPKQGSKAEGIKKVADKLGVGIKKVAAFGDGLNDVEMLKTVGYGVAMGNACLEAKKAAKFITMSVDEDGIMHGLKMIRLL